MIGADSRNRIIRRHLNYNRVPHTKEIYALINAIVKEALLIDRMDREGKEKTLKSIRRVTE